MPRKRGFWNFASDHPFITFFGTIVVVDGIVLIVKTLVGKPNVPCRPCPPCAGPLIKIN